MQPPSATDGLEIVRGVEAQALVDDALRLLHLDMLEHGHSVRTLSEWLRAMHWFPHLNQRDEILALAQALPAQWLSGTLCDPQILLQSRTSDPNPRSSSISTTSHRGPTGGATHGSSGCRSARGAARTAGCSWRSTAPRSRWSSTPPTRSC